MLKELDVEKEKKKRDYQRKKELKEKRKLEKKDNILNINGQE